MSKKKKIIVGTNGIEIRLHNRRICVVEYPERSSFVFETVTYDKGNAHTPATIHNTLGPDVRITTMLLTEESLRALAQGLNNYFAQKEFIKP